MQYDFCFESIIEQELQDLVTEWNSHRIRSSKMAEVPAGKPDVLYHFPELHGKNLVFIFNCACRFHSTVHTHTSVQVLMTTYAVLRVLSSAS